MRREAEEDWGKMKSAQPTSVTIQQIEFELEKVDRGMAMPYDAERVRQFAQHAPRGAQAEAVSGVEGDRRPAERVGL